MGIHRTPRELKNIIIKGTQHLVAVGGISNFSFPKLSAETGISAPTVYEHYKNKEELLQSCFMKTDFEVVNLVKKFIKKMPIKWDSSPDKINSYFQLMWTAYWNFLLADKEKTLFYWHYYNSDYYAKELAVKRDENFADLIMLINELDAKYNISKEHNFRILLANIINATVRCAVKVIDGEYENDEITQKTIYIMIFQPVFSIFGIDAYKQSMIGE